MPIDHPAAARLKARFPGLALKGAQFKGDTQIVVPKSSFLDVVTFLKNDPQLQYNFLADVTAVDYLNYPGAPKDGRFGIVYILSSIPATAGEGGGGGPRLILRVFLDESDLEIESLVPLYAGAEWLEREVFDMFGIRFLHHPDLRRILTWDTFQAHPLRKDYPVTGRGEREQYPVLTRESA
jgi:NADH-quinone oxidoreductase subunit C